MYHLLQMDPRDRLFHLNRAVHRNMVRTLLLRYVVDLLWTGLRHLLSAHIADFVVGVQLLYNLL